jgi:hypothetical protein
VGYSARPFDEARDRAALLGLWGATLSDRSLTAKLEARYRWLYGGAREHRLRTFLVVDDTTGEVIGCSSLVPHAVSVAGVLRPAGIGVDLAIAKGHRVAGPAVVLQRAVVEAVARGELGEGAFCFAYPNDGALPVVKRVGYRVVAKTSHAVKPVRTGYKLAPRLPSPALAAPLARAGDFALALLDRGRLLRAPLLHRGEIFPHPDERFDALFDRVRRTVPVLGDRRAAFLDWRYAQCPTREHLIVGVTSRDGRELLSYAIVAFDGATAVLVDTLAASEAASVATFTRLATELRRRACDSIFASFVGPGHLVVTLRASGFFPRGEERSMVVYAPHGAPEAVTDAARWHIFDGELDL